MKTFAELIKKRHDTLTSSQMLGLEVGPTKKVTSLTSSPKNIMASLSPSKKMTSLLANQRRRSRSQLMPSNFSVAFLGDERVGKSSIITLFTSGQSPAHVEYVPTVSEVFRAEMSSVRESCRASLTIYDTSGSLDFPAMTRLTLAKCDGCAIVYDVTCSKSLTVAKRKLTEIRETRGESFPCVLIGNKIEQHDKRVVSFEQGLRCAVHYKCSYVEVSAKLRKNVHEVFDSLLKKMSDRRLHTDTRRTSAANQNTSTSVNQKATKHEQKRQRSHSAPFL